MFKYTCVHTHNSGIDFLSPRTPQVSPWCGRWRPLEMMIVPKVTWRFSLRSSAEVQSSICKKNIKKRTKFKRWQSPQATLRPSKLMLMLLACGFEYAKRIYASKWRLQMAPFLCVAEHPTSLSCLWFLQDVRVPADNMIWGEARCTRDFAWKHQLHPIAQLQSPFKALKHHCKWLCLEKAFGCCCLQELDSNSSLEIRMPVSYRYM